jgi:hypothetical protein
VAPVAGFLDSLTPAELAALQDRLRSAERKALGAARIAPDEYVWPLVRVAGDVRALMDDAFAADRDAIADGSRA